MRRFSAFGALCLVALLGAVVAPAGGELSVQGLTSIGEATAGMSRAGGEGGGGGGGSGGGGSALQFGPKTATLLQRIVASLLFIGTAIGIGIAAMQRNAGMAVLVVVLALVIGAFALAPDQMENTFLDIYRFVL